MGFDVLTGHNIRDSTEVLTRRRIVAINLATVDLFLKGSALSDNFITELPRLATAILGAGALSKAERWLAQWVLGLTDKASQNVLRDNPESLEIYRDLPPDNREACGIQWAIVWQLSPSSAL